MSVSRRRSGPVRRVLFVIVAGLIVTADIAHHLHHPKPHPATTTDAASLRTLDGLRVVPDRLPQPGYQRGCGRGQACSFGPAWTDDTTAPGGHNGCDTRNDVLRTQLTEVTYRPGSRCVVESGVLHDPYLGLPIRFDKTHAAAVQIDHIVPLAWAWDLGANTWTPAQRAAFANDEQLELLAVNGPSNEKKADNGPAAWLNVIDPPDYARRFIAVLAHYQLPIDVADKAALTTALNGDHS